MKKPNIITLCCCRTKRCSVRMEKGAEHKVCDDDDEKRLPTRSIYPLHSAFEAKSITILFSPNLFHSHAIHKAVVIVIATASIPLRSGYFIYRHVHVFYGDKFSHL